MSEHHGGRAQGAAGCHSCWHSRIILPSHYSCRPQHARDIDASGRCGLGARRPAAAAAARYRYPCSRVSRGHCGTAMSEAEPAPAAQMEPELELELTAADALLLEAAVTGSLARIDRKGKRMRPSPTALKLVARDRNRVAPKATGGFATARAAAGVLAVSGHQQKATPDSGKGARPRAERSPRSPIVHRRHLKFGAVSDSAQSPVHHARLGGSGLATGSPPPAPLQPARTGVRIGLSGARSRSPVRTDKEEELASGGGTHI